MLKKSQKRRGWRRGVGLIYAIIVLLAIATITTYSLYNSSQIVKVTTDEHIRIQMDLYLRSAAEWTILWMQQDRDYSQKEQNVSLKIDSYEFNISTMPITGSHSIEESNGTVLVDIIGRVNIDGMDNFRVTKRYLLKP